jgi:hypothetical protein
VVASLFEFNALQAHALDETHALGPRQVPAALSLGPGATGYSGSIHGEVSTVIQSTCHCGAVSIAIPRAPAAVTNCNCSVCRRYGALWAYFDASEVKVVARPDAVDEYRWADRSLAFVRCHACGCVTHWSPVPGKRKTPRMGVNIRMFEPAALGPFKIRFLDGAVTEEFVGEWAPTPDAAPP